MELVPSSERKVFAQSYVNDYCITQSEATVGCSNVFQELQKKVNIAFETFDQYLPLLGVLKNVFELIRKDLYDGVYSNMKTTDNSKLQGVPYFCLCDRIVEKREQEAEILRNTLESKENFIFELKEMLSQGENTIHTLRSKLTQEQAQSEEKAETIKDLLQEKYRLSKGLKDLNEQIEYQAKRNESLVDRSRVRLSNLEESVASLNKYKENFDKLDVDFQSIGSAMRKKSFHPNITNPQELKRREHEEQLKSINKLKTNLYNLQSRLISEYEKHLDERKKNFKHAERQRSVCSELVEEGKEKERERAELAAVRIAKKNFLQSVRDIKKELSLLEEQENSIVYELDGITEKPKLSKKPSFGSTSDGKQSEAVVTNDLIKMMDGGDVMINPFIPHQQIFNKFSFMLMASSNNGQHYNEVPGWSYCQSCHEKTFMCLHTPNESEQIISFSSPCTNLKIVRPTLKVPSKQEKKMNKLTKKETQVYDNTVTSSLSIRLKKNSIMGTNVWQWYTSYYPTKPHLTRTLSKDEFMEMVYEFFAYLLWEDEFQPIDEAVPSFLDSLRNFAVERYHDNEIVGVVLHEILFHTEKYYNESEEIELFAKTCSGLFDASVYRYLFVLADVINTQSWCKMEQVEGFFRTIYPLCADEEIDSIKIGYTSFSENRVTRRLLFRYLLYVILRETEPRMFEVSTSLHSHSVRRAGYFNDIEFTEVIESMTPFYSERSRQRLFTSAILSSNGEKGCIKTRTAAHICAYLVATASIFHKANEKERKPTNRIYYLHIPC